MAKFKVLRSHLGDKMYQKGDIREANPSQVSHLVGKVLAVATAEDLKPAKAKAATKSKAPAKSTPKSKKASPAKKK